jgi:uncharacterized protein DUF3761/SH3 domain-containing protein
MNSKTDRRSFFISAIALVSFLAITSFGCSSLSVSKSLANPKLEATNSSVAQSSSPTQATAVVKSIKANLRDQPSRFGAVVEEVDKGNRLLIVNSNPVGPWYRVRTLKSNTEGWIHGNVIVLTQTPATTTTTERADSPVTSSRTRPSTSRSYINVDGERIPSPVFSEERPAGATARCRDGSYSFSQHRRGTCSHHGGVAVWLN